MIMMSEVKNTNCQHRIQLSLFNNVSFITWMSDWEVKNTNCQHRIKLSLYQQCIFYQLYKINYQFINNYYILLLSRTFFFFNILLFRFCGLYKLKKEKFCYILTEGSQYHFVKLYFTFWHHLTCTVIIFTSFII